MNHYLYSMLALDLARERSQEAQQRWLESRLVATTQSRPPRIRRVAARLLASVSLGSAAMVRRLDSCVADDLGRSMAPVR